MSMILLVDDDPLTRAAHGLMLGERGHTVIHSPDGSHALLCLRCNRFDLLVLDHQMPGMTGGELLRHLGDEGLRLPTIMVSGAIGPREVQGLLDDGADFFIAKPVPRPVLLDYVERCLALRPATQVGTHAWPRGTAP